MNKLKPLTAMLLLSAFSQSARADAQADGEMIANATFCSMYSTRLTMTDDSGLQIRGVNLNARLNGPAFNRILQVMNDTYGKTWLESNARNGSMTAMQLSQTDLIYKQGYASECENFVSNVEKQWRSK